VGTDIARLDNARPDNVAPDQTEVYKIIFMLHGISGLYEFIYQFVLVFFVICAYYCIPA